MNKFFKLIAAQWVSKWQFFCRKVEQNLGSRTLKPLELQEWFSYFFYWIQCIYRKLILQSILKYNHFAQLALRPWIKFMNWLKSSKRLNSSSSSAIFKSMGRGFRKSKGLGSGCMGCSSIKGLGAYCNGWIKGGKCSFLWVWRRCFTVAISADRALIWLDKSLWMLSRNVDGRATAIGFEISTSIGCGCSKSSTEGGDWKIGGREAGGGM